MRRKTLAYIDLYAIAGSFDSFLYFLNEIKEENKDYEKLLIEVEPGWYEEYPTVCVTGLLKKEEK